MAGKSRFAEAQFVLVDELAALKDAAKQQFDAVVRTYGEALVKDMEAKVCVVVFLWESVRECVRVRSFVVCVHVCPRRCRMCRRVVQRMRTNETNSGSGLRGRRRKLRLRASGWRP